MNNLNETQSLINMNSFIDKLKKEDKRLHKIYKSIKILYIVLLIIFIPIFILELKKGGTIQLIKVISFFMGFSTFVILFGYMQKKLNKINYAVSTLSLLKATVKRYKLFNIKDIIGFLGFILIIFGVTINEKVFLAYKVFKHSNMTWGKYFSKFWHSFINSEIHFWSFSDVLNEYPLIVASGSIIFVIFLMIISFVAGFFIWEQRHKPIRNNALSLIKEIES